MSGSDEITDERAKSPRDLLTASLPFTLLTSPIDTKPPLPSTATRSSVLLGV